MQGPPSPHKPREVRRGRPGQQPDAYLTSARAIGLNHRSTARARVSATRSGRLMPSMSAPTWPNAHEPGRRQRPISRAVSAAVDSPRPVCSMPDLGFAWWEVQGSNPGRLSRRFYREHPAATTGAVYLRERRTERSRAAHSTTPQPPASITCRRQPDVTGLTDMAPLAGPRVAH